MIAPTEGGLRRGIPRVEGRAPDKFKRRLWRPWPAKVKGKGESWVGGEHPSRSDSAELQPDGGSKGKVTSRFFGDVGRLRRKGFICGGPLPRGGGSGQSGEHEDHELTGEGHGTTSRSYRPNWMSNRGEIKPRRAEPIYEGYASSVLCGQGE